MFVLQAGQGGGLSMEDLILLILSVGIFAGSFLGTYYSLRVGRLVSGGRGAGPWSMISASKVTLALVTSFILLLFIPEVASELGHQILLVIFLFFLANVILYAIGIRWFFKIVERELKPGR